MRTRLLVFAAALCVGVGVWISRPWGTATAPVQPARADKPASAPRWPDISGGQPRGGVLPVVGLTGEANAALEKNGFVVVMSERNFEGIDTFYSDCKWARQPVFVTTDSVLHTSHLVFDWYLRFLETAHLRSDLLNLTDSGIAMSMAYWDQAGSRALKEAALRNAAYFYVAKALLGEAKLSEVPDGLRQQIQAELKLIDGHAGFAASPIFGYKEDYSQYVPRGHYSRSAELSSYFRAMMWYGRMSFPLREDITTMQAVLVCKALNEGRAKGETAMQVWRRVSEITAFFSGSADDLTPRDYLPSARRIFGEDLPLAPISDGERLDRFRKEVSELPKPRILSTFAASTDSKDWRTRTQGLRLMGQRSTLDGHIFQQLVFDRVGKWKGSGDKPFTLTNAQGMPVRGFARGLDVLAALGSDEAKSIIESEGDASFEGYATRLAELRKACAVGSEPADLYSARLALLRTVSAGAEAGAPAFMKSTAWKRKSIAAALGSWTELRHDTILYTKQPYSMAQAAFATMGKGGPQEKPKPVHGYVEPAPGVYAAVRTTVAQLRKRIDTLGFPPDRALTGNLEQFEKLLTSLETISLKELKGRRPTAEEQDVIENFGDRLRSATRFAHYMDVSRDFQTIMDKDIRIVADVCTDVNSGKVLEEGLGYPLAIYVGVPVDGRPTVCKGAVYSYYEFKQPMAERLTDEDWRKLFVEGPAQELRLPAWTDAFVPRRK